MVTNDPSMILTWANAMPQYALRIREAYVQALHARLAFLTALTILASASIVLLLVGVILGRFDQSSVVWVLVFISTLWYRYYKESYFRPVTIVLKEQEKDRARS